MAVNNKYLFSELGSELVEKLYQRALRIELLKNEMQFNREKRISMKYQGVNIGFDKVDFDVEEKVLVELKAVSELNDIHMAQMISYLKSSGRRIGLLLNFAKLRLEIKRIAV
ncbi:MAG: GxxExxY protein [Candidatus Levybacteria bacterium]|nr:GxxExxY protein [Candidatus Levybacteria bacterium]